MQGFLSRDVLQFGMGPRIEILSFIFGILLYTFHSLAFDSRLLLWFFPSMDLTTPFIKHRLIKSDVIFCLYSFSESGRIFNVFVTIIKVFSVVELLSEVGVGEVTFLSICSIYQAANFWLVIDFNHESLSGKDNSD